mmetsp:Transcript_1719/g.3790  ORF Transcript_1719/g.3790 Transcript_1719/m.3790 type:complete len:304 (+) Transcript_1719:115-1026(+)|eukprot:CAMPEP_0206472130 /NCGR_PEP_ID=MMETSP0324_2-20121206/32001_1 /ASSEMBLY_ACC=CAM_ASM_000836 /TAXON_ID=2866 /ORGANISM="Crypthecodinium cohnii, Strain Seligo" /LENGTH=303 /DNA_ID=CAMNT_0053946639 /DNA_START=89 /DNA_END=1000 /DNA_ORIENTATION=+
MEALEREGSDSITEVSSEDIQLQDVLYDSSIGKVFRGLWSNQEVSVKYLADPLDSEDSPLSPYARELFVLSRVQHPNIVRVLAKVSSQKPRALVTESCRGGCCADYLYAKVEPQTSLTLPQSLRIIKDLANAMLCLHTFDPPILHRAIRSTTLLLKEPISSPHSVPCAKLSDFSVAQPKAGGKKGSLSAKDPNDDWLSTTRQVGISNWVAPEVFDGNSYNEKVDVYSFAMVFFELIFHELPFEDCDPVEIAVLVTNGRRPCLDDSPSSCHPGLIALTERCWAHHADRRPCFRDVVTLLDAFPG